MTEDKVLPKDTDSDYSLPGRIEESNAEYFEIDNIPPKPQNKIIIIVAISFLLISAGAFTFYFINQPEIDSQLIDNTLNFDPEKQMIEKYNIGEYGSDHAHAAILITIDGEQLNFGLNQFQLSSKYIHFENHNPYMIHKHAVGVPLEMLFTSFNLEITQDCIILNYEKSKEFCSENDQHLLFFLNGEKYYPDISQYEIKHDDRIMISFGGEKSISKNLAYLESLEISEVPKRPQSSGNDISI
ncbi:MAG: hypothetical protein HOK63_04020 [Thaumarchaeota archaeon]|nr:hypothetical protein [Nitrososphaerota archaeon]MBT5841997.1 hypothetical protein [Nitrososphaerota archaeon]MBT6468801.1 hypothetical protein [Nitrososphaerota archaeon]